MNRHGQERARAAVAVALPDHPIVKRRHAVGVRRGRLSTRTAGRIQTIEHASRLRDLVSGEQVQGDARRLHRGKVVLRRFGTPRKPAGEAAREGSAVRVRWTR